LTKSEQIEHVQFVAKRRNFVDIFAKNGNVAKNDNNVEATSDFVEATFDFVERIVRLVALDNVASTLLLVWMGLLQSCLLLQLCCFDNDAAGVD